MPLKLVEHANGTFYVRGTIVVWRAGRTVSQEIFKSTRTKDRKQADAIRRQIENAVAEQNVTGRQPAITFRAAAERYLANGGEGRFLKKPLAALGHLRIDEISQELIDDEGLKAYANSSTRRRQFHAPTIAVLRSAGIRQQFDRPPDGEKRTFWLRPEQAVSIIDRVIDSRFPNPWTPAFATFLFGQGSRVSETLAIDGRDDISLPDRYAILRDTKNGRERLVTLCPRVIAALTAIPNLGQPGPLFLRYDGRPYTVRQGEVEGGRHFPWWSRAVREVGLDPRKFSPHTARHSWATWFYSQTKDVLRLKAEGGWESDEWLRYAKLAIPSIGRDAMRYGFDFRQESQEHEDGTIQNEQGTLFTDFSRKGR